MTSSSLGVSLAVAFVIVSIGLVSVGLSTDYWLQYNVDYTILELSGFTKEIQTTEHWNTRHRGIFRECYTNKTRSFLSLNTIDINCKYLEFEIPESDGFEQRSQSYKTFIHLRRCVVGFLLLCILLMVVGLVMGGLGCWLSPRKLTRAAGILVLLAVFFGVAAMAFFHGAKVLEDDKIEEKDIAWLRSSWNTSLKQYTTMRYRWSYILTWVGLGVGIISSVLFLIASWITHQKDKGLMKLHDRLSMRSRAYEYFDFPNFTSEKGSVRGGYVAPEEMYENRGHSVVAATLPRGSGVEPGEGSGTGPGPQQADSTWRWDSDSPRY